MFLRAYKYTILAMRVRCERLMLLKMSLYLVFRNKSGASRYWCIYVYTQRNGEGVWTLVRYTSNWDTACMMRYSVRCYQKIYSICTLVAAALQVMRFDYIMYNVYVCKAASPQSLGLHFPSNSDSRMKNIYICFYIKIPIERMIL